MAFLHRCPGLMRDYRLDDDVLPRAPDRFLFSQYPNDAVRAALELTNDYPEKRGTFSHAARETRLSPKVLDADEITIEAHIDGRNLPQTAANDLLTLGFEPDGFAEYHPVHFNFHSTLKFSVPRTAFRRLSKLFRFARINSEAAFRILSSQNVEAYIELEVYPSSNRRRWLVKPLDVDWERSFPLDERTLAHGVVPPILCGELEGLRKRADLHVKIAYLTRAGADPSKLIDKLCRCGFYNLLTWADNDICTAEFLHAKDAIKIFYKLSDFFDRFGGAAELTLEHVSAFWRTSIRANGCVQLAALPRLVLGVS